MTRFWLGTHMPDWLWKTDVDLFVSFERFSRVKRPRGRALAHYAVDSGAFSQLKKFGQFTVTARQYVDGLLRFRDVAGQPVWCSPQDWMCEPAARERTGRSVRDHQRLTVSSFLELRDMGGRDFHFIPVLQGWSFQQYLSCLEVYRENGVDLAAEPLVGLGSVCGRQDTEMAEDLIACLAGLGLKVHAFGFKLHGLAAAAPHLSSADSMAWSFQARNSPPMQGHKHATCAHCLEYATAWYWRVRDMVARSTARGRQGILFNGEA